MTNAWKLLDQMRLNPQNWRIEQLETVAKRCNVNIRKSGGSHVVFEHEEWVELLSIPSRRPIKPIYVKKFVALIESLGY